jgi:Fur family peroxide stress response transcriptional regulator
MSKNAVNENIMLRFKGKCEEHGLKITPQRTVIYNEILHSREHPTANAIYEKVKVKLPNISFDTVNRTLLSFSKIGILDIVEGYGDPRRFDPDLEPHHHFRCVECSDIIDFKEKKFDDLDIPANVSKRFNVFHKKVLLEGLCDKCIKKNR